MFYGNTITGKITRGLSDKELSALTEDIYSVKARCRKLGSLFGKPNYIMNIFDEMEFDEISESHKGSLTVYFETEARDDELAQDITSLLSKYEIQVVSFTRKLKA